MFDDFNEAPPLQLTERTRLHDANGVTHLRFSFFVMRIEALDLLDDFAEAGVGHARRGLDHGCLLHLGAHHLTYTLFTKRAGFLGGLGRCLGHGYLNVTAQPLHATSG